MMMIIIIITLRKVHSSLKDMYYLNTNTEKLSNPTLGSSSVKLNVQDDEDDDLSSQSF